MGNYRPGLGPQWVYQWPLTVPLELTDMTGWSTGFPTPPDHDASQDLSDSNVAQTPALRTPLAIDPMFPLSPRAAFAQSEPALPQPNAPPGMLDPVGPALPAWSGGQEAQSIAADPPVTPRSGATADWIAPASPKPRSQTGRSINPNLGVPVQLPNGDRIPDLRSPTGHVMGPVDDLAAVAAAGRKIGEMYQIMSAHEPIAAATYLAAQLGLHVGHGGLFDYQREGKTLSGFTQLPQWRNVSNVNVGVLCQQAGLSLDDTLRIAGAYARMRSRNADPTRATGLDERTEEYTRIGHEIGRNGVFNAPSSR